MERRPPQSSRLTWLAVAFVAGVCSILGTVGGDAHWLAAIGRTIVARGSIPAGVPYAAAPSSDWVNVPVLGELVFHALQALGGDKALLLFQLLAATVAFTLLAFGMRARGAPDAARAAVLLMVFLSAIPAFVILRAQVFSLVLFCALLLLLRSETKHPSNRIWLLVPLVALWTNLHGAVLVGLAVSASYLAFERFRRQPVTSGGVLVACVGALFLTPALGHSGDYYLGVLRSEAALSGEGMWGPLSPSLQAPFDLLFVLLIVPLLLLACRRMRLWELVCAAVLVAVTVHAGRNGIWLACLVAAPAAYGLGRGSLRNFTVSPRALILCGSVPALFLVLGIIQTPQQAGAGERVRQHAATLAAGQPILADGLDAEQFALDRQRVWMANPLDAFSRRDQRLYLDWLDAKPAGDELLRRGSPVVVVTRGSPPQQRLARDRSFRRVALDRHAAVYVRVSSVREVSR
ncbi:MAG: hypothetical protein QOF27_2935 [Gaiellaceae bacterium]|nr:hypothetical protein [Gaiellaceae bacterium]